MKKITDLYRELSLIAKTREEIEMVLEFHRNYVEEIENTGVFPDDILQRDFEVLEFDIMVNQLIQMDSHLSLEEKLSLYKMTNDKFIKQIKES